MMQGFFLVLINSLIILLGFCTSCLSYHNASSNSVSFQIYNVMKYGAVGDGFTDDSAAFGRAWRHMCEGSHHRRPIYKVPRGKTFYLKPMRFRGPCKPSHIKVKVLGKIVAPSSIDGWRGCKENSWLVFSDIQGLTIVGSGQFDGQGSIWWATHPSPPSKCNWPTAVLLERCSDVRVHGTTHINSPRNHISITACNVVELANLHVTSPMHSPNTDGIDISFSTNLRVTDSTIRTGDDCVAIGHNSSFINITNTICGPGHGISIGSLGASNAYETVEEILVRNCTFKSAIHGVRIKTWEGGSGYARKITFEDITFEATWNPIIIDQHYCTIDVCTKNESSAVRISDVTYRNLNGTTQSGRAINLKCSKNMGCTNLGFENINIISSQPGIIIPYAYCENAYGWFSSSFPPPTCLWK